MVRTVDAAAVWLQRGWMVGAHTLCVVVLLCLYFCCYRGHFARVKKCRDVLTGKQYAVKIIEKKELLKNSAAVKAEIDILRAVGHHPHIVNLIDQFEDSSKCYIVMELCSGGDLFSQIVEHGKYSEAQAVRACKQLASALQWIHSKGVTHRDLKPENILLTSNSIDADLKVADFGLSKLLKGHQHVMKTICGTCKLRTHYFACSLFMICILSFVIVAVSSHSLLLSLLLAAIFQGRNSIIARLSWQHRCFWYVWSCSLC